MRETEPTKTFTGRRYKVHLWEDEEEITVSLKRNGAWATGMVGPLLEQEYSELFQAKVTQKGVDQAAMRLVREIAHSWYRDELSNPGCSENFPINRYYISVEDRLGAIPYLMALLVRVYLEPTGEDRKLRLGDITRAAEKCIRELVEPNLAVSIEIQHYPLGRDGTVWRVAENSWRVEIHERRIGDKLLRSEFWVEAHEVGHLMAHYFGIDDLNKRRYK